MSDKKDIAVQHNVEKSSLSGERLSRIVEQVVHNYNTLSNAIKKTAPANEAKETQDNHLITLLNDNSFMESLKHARASHFNADITTLATQTMKELLHDDKGAVRFNASKWLLESAGHGLAARQGNEGIQELATMTRAQLERVVKQGEAVLSREPNLTIEHKENDDGEWDDILG